MTLPVSSWADFADTLEDDDEDDFTEDEIDDILPAKAVKTEKAKKRGPLRVSYQQAPEETLRILTEVPQAFIEPTVKNYAHDGADFIVPDTPSFVTDFINLGRGSESPTLFLLWGALWTLSAALNRNAWLQWYPSPLWPNLYVLVVAPAGICKKSVPLSFGEKLLVESAQYRLDTMDAFTNEYRFVKSKSSPSGMYMMLKPETRVFLDGSKIMSARRSSKLTVCMPEMGTLLSKQQYMTGVVDDITNFYDCLDKDSLITRDRGIEELENIYVTLIGAITPTGLEESLPKEALSGGFVSRSIIAFQDSPTKIYSRPVKLEGYPEVDEVAKRLAWIAHNARGEYFFSPEADAAFDQWYVQWKTRILSGEITLREDEHRRDILIRKTAMLLRVAEYRPGREITLKNFQDAQRILDYTLAMTARLVGNLGGSDFSKQLTRVKDYIHKKRTLNRRQLLNRFGGQIRSADITVLVNQLIDQGYLVATLDNKPVPRSLGLMKETYTSSTLEEIHAS